MTNPSSSSSFCVMSSFYPVFLSFTISCWFFLLAFIFLCSNRQCFHFSLSSHPLLFALLAFFPRMFSPVTLFSAINLHFHSSQTHGLLFSTFLTSSLQLKKAVRRNEVTEHQRLWKYQANNWENSIHQWVKRQTATHEQATKEFANWCFLVNE